MSVYIHKSHNVSVIIYHLVCPAKYRRVVFDRKVDEEIKQICLEIARVVKSITAREVFSRLPEVKKLLLGGDFGQMGITSRR